MDCSGFEPGAAGWKAQTDPLSYGGSPTQVSYLSVSFLIEQLSIHSRNVHHPDTNKYNDGTSKSVKTQSSQKCAIYCIWTSSARLVDVSVSWLVSQTTKYVSVSWLVSQTTKYVSVSWHVSQKRKQNVSVSCHVFLKAKNR